jgi:hypothetical protein
MVHEYYIFAICYETYAQMFSERAIDWVWQCYLHLEGSASQIHWHEGRRVGGRGTESLVLSLFCCKEGYAT